MGTFIENSKIKAFLRSVKTEFIRSVNSNGTKWQERYSIALSIMVANRAHSFFVKIVLNEITT